MNELTPRAKTTIIGEGTVVQHDVTRKGLHRMKVECANKNPSLEMWSSLLPAEARLISCWAEMNPNPAGFIGVLWIYYKIGR